MKNTNNFRYTGLITLATFTFVFFACIGKVTAQKRDTVVIQWEKLIGNIGTGPNHKTTIDLNGNQVIASDTGKAITIVKIDPQGNLLNEKSFTKNGALLDFYRVKGGYALCTTDSLYLIDESYKKITVFHKTGGAFNMITAVEPYGGNYIVSSNRSISNNDSAAYLVTMIDGAGNESWEKEYFRVSIANKSWYNGSMKLVDKSIICYLQRTDTIWKWSTQVICISIDGNIRWNKILPYQLPSNNWRNPAVSFKKKFASLAWDSLGSHLIQFDTLGNVSFDKKTGFESLLKLNEDTLVMISEYWGGFKKKGFGIKCLVSDSIISFGPPNFYTIPDSADFISTSECINRGSIIIVQEFQRKYYTDSVHWQTKSLPVMYIAKISLGFDTTSVINGIEQNGEIHFHLYPNPSNGLFLVEAKGSGNLLLFDELGKMVFEKKIYNGTDYVNVQHLPAGVYICKFIVNGYEKTEKIVIQ